MKAGATVTTSSRPTCEVCKHPISFHGSGGTPCRALGCTCTSYKGASLLASQTVNTSEAAEMLGRSFHWVKTHADELGGIEVPEKDLRIGSKSTKRSVRFYRDRIQRAATKADEAAV